MDAERWRRARALFEQLAESPAAEWEARLAAACPDDAGVRAEALALLRADAESTEPTGLADVAPALVSGLAGEYVEPVAPDHAGMRLGPFRLVREIGRGGMGAVWLAERVDGGFDQQVAIKLIRGGWDGQDAARRFHAERQILATLQHPNIAHLVDGGVSADGKPWLALEYIDGEELRAWCDRRALGVESRLRLMITVCAAVSHAHQHLVVHRDLKPSNILVGRNGVVKLLDFGIAKLIDAPGTDEATATRVFTPEYAAPEQVQGGPVTTAVDVYALGLLLHELLTGRRLQGRADDPAGARAPTRPSSLVVRENDDGEAARIAARRESTPRRLRRRLQGDLDAIILKALRPEPQMRYASVAALVADLQRHLDDKPVHAHRGGWRYRAGRFARRHRWALAASAAAVLALAGGLGAALWQAREARVQRDTAQEALAFMTSLFRNADPGERGRANLGARDLLDEGARGIRHALAGNDDVRVRLLLSIASAYIDLDLPDPAEPLLDEADLIAARSGDPLRAAEALQLRCALLVQRDRTDACAPLLARAEAALDPRDPEQAGMIAQGLYLGARDLLHHNRHEDIVANSRRALALLDHAPARRELRAELHDTLAFSLVKLDRAAEAEALLRPLVDELAAAGDAPRALAEAQDTLAGALFAQGQNEEGLRLREDSLRTLESLYGPDHSVLADNLINLGIAHYRAGQLDRAEEVLERAVRVARTKGDTQASALLAGLASLGTVEFLRRADQDARNHLDESIALATRLQRPVDAGRALRWRGIVGFAEGRAAEARADFEQSLALLSPMHPPEHATMLQTRTLMLALRFASAGAAARAPGGCEEAGDLARRFVAAAGADDPDARIAQSLDRLCNAETGQAEATLVGLSAALPAEDYRQRLVAHLAAAWTPTPGRSAL